MYEFCMLCPRECGVNRTAGESGFCGEAWLQGEEARARVAVACLHRGEEPPITGETGSGTVFFSGCTLQCPSCQNRQISRGHLGRQVSDDELAEIFLALQKKGAETLNLVTGTQFIPSIINAMALAKLHGLSIPVVWNSSGFEKPEIVRLLNGIVDIYLPDLKTLSPALARDLFCCPQYPVAAESAILAMADSKPLLWENDFLRTGVILRHLALPGHLARTRECLAWFTEKLKSRVVLSLMTQYIPLPCENGVQPYIREKITADEHDRVREYLDELGIEEGFFQELASDEEWIPDFRSVNPFPEEFATPVWHYSCGFVQ